ncbi:UvrD-helicase domain-containing protein [Vibrio anguillarum]|uniref:UvrD-helicase domain-containing protein n=1 Tax=Vibrio anguillarum TaxID=55601 RepID=UPI0013E0923D|nr:UvrD-helicase domain-containing protein [Vibrio anguillarum]
MIFDGLVLSEEQRECIEKAKALPIGGELLIEAGAGASKTFTLKALAKLVMVNRRGMYLAYNNEIVKEVKSMFPTSTDVLTTHGLAHRYVGRYFALRLKANMTLRMFVNIFNVHAIGHYGVNKIAKLAMQSVCKFCISDDDTLGVKHVKTVCASAPQLVDVVLFYAKRYWIELNNYQSSMPVFHDAYLKIFALKLKCKELIISLDYLMMDECQDTAPVVKQIYDLIVSPIKIAVGDRFQAIYLWRGAIDSMNQFSQEHVASLTTCYRFGDEIASLANKTILATHDERPCFKGNPDKHSVIHLTPFDVDIDSQFIISRTNADLYQSMMTSFELGRKPKPLKSADVSINLLNDIKGLKTKGKAVSFELAAFESYSELKEQVNNGLNSDMKSLIAAVEQYGVDDLLTRFNEMTETRYQANDILTTAHSSKGMEANNVVLSQDFDYCINPNTSNLKEEGSLLYVALTRVKSNLDVSRCSTIKKILSDTFNQKMERKSSVKRDRFLQLFGN